MVNRKPYQIVLKKSVLKDVRRIPQSILQSIQTRISALADDPVPSGSEPIQGYAHHYRIRIGSYRILYEIALEIRIITIIKVGHRKDVYKNI